MKLCDPWAGWMSKDEFLTRLRSSPAHWWSTTYLHQMIQAWNQFSIEEQMLVNKSVDDSRENHESLAVVVVVGAELRTPVETLPDYARVALWGLLRELTAPTLEYILEQADIQGFVAGDTVGNA